MKKFFKFLGWILLIALIGIQFFRPEKNQSSGEQPNAISKLHSVPDDVKVILKKACDDCHTNNTVYPWYNNIQPVAWWLNDHVVDGKKHLNLDEIAARPAWLRYHKMEEVKEQVEKGEMPLDSYTWIHKEAILTDGEKEKITGWAQSIMDEMKQTLPADSLVRPKRPEAPRKD